MTEFAFLAIRLNRQKFLLKIYLLAAILAEMDAMEEILLKHLLITTTTALSPEMSTMTLNGVNLTLCLLATIILMELMAHAQQSYLLQNVRNLACVLTIKHIL